MNLLRLALRGIGREWRLPEVRTLAAALLLAVASLGAVSTLGARVERALLARAATMIGGDLGVSSTYQPLPAAFDAEAARLGLRRNASASFPSMAFHAGAGQLLDVLATGPDWPLRGHVQLAGADGRPVRGRGPPPGTAYLDSRALQVLHLRVGDEVQLGGLNLRVAARLLRMPDGGELIALAPRAVMNLGDAGRAGLLGPGSRASHRLMLAGPAAAIDRYAAWARARLPRGAHLVTPKDLQQRMRFAFDRASRMLVLITLLSTLLSGVAIALAARRYALRKVDEVALLRALGAPRHQALGLPLLRLGAIALLALTAGALAAIGLAAIGWHFAQVLLGQPAAALPLRPVLGAVLTGAAVLVGFALPALAPLARIPPIAVFRRSALPRGHLSRALYLLPLLVVLALLAGQGGSLRLGGVLLASLAGAAVIAAATGALLLELARRSAARVHPALRIGLAALARRRALSLLQTVALALGLTALLLLGIITPSLLRQWQQALPARTPNWFVLNLQPVQRASFAEAVANAGGTSYNTLPLVVGNLSAINGVPIAQWPFRDAEDRRWAEHTLRISYAAALPAGNRIVAGRWPARAPAVAEASLDRGWAQRFGIHLGDTLRLQVGEDDLAARVTSLRAVRWDSFRVNFFVMLDAPHGARLPHNWLASFYLPPGRAGTLQGLSQRFSNLSLIDVDSLLAQVRGITAQVAAALRCVLGFSLIAGALVMLAALAASARERRHEAALLRTLGADRRQLLLASAAEFALLGGIGGATGALGAAGAGLWLARSIFDLEHFAVPWFPLAAAVPAVALAVMLLGLAGAQGLLRTSPLKILRQG